MQSITMNLMYRGAEVNIYIQPESDFRGMLYPVEMNDQYAFTILFNEDEEWSIMREDNGTTPFIEADLLKSILKQLQYDLQYAA